MATGTTARAIAITPLGKPELDIKEFGTLRVLHVSTGLTSEDRDLTNAATADAVIALEGATGTLLELAFAHAFNKPIYFPGSQPQLSGQHREHIRNGTLRKYIESALTNYPIINARERRISEVERALEEAIERGIPLDPDHADRALEEVLAARPTTQLLPTFPGIPPDHAATAAAFFKLWNDLLSP